MKLSKTSQAARIARFGYMRWFTSMDVIMSLRLTQPHPRLLDIKAAGGVIVSEPVEINGVKCHRYMVTKMPQIRERAGSGFNPTSGE